MEKTNKFNSKDSDELSEGTKNMLPGSYSGPSFPDQTFPIPSIRRIQGKKQLDVQGILDEQDGFCEHITVVPKKMSQHDTNIIIRSLNKHLFFSNLSVEELGKIIS